MSVGMDGVDAVLARISQIQAGLVSAGVLPAAPSTGPSTTGTALGSAAFAGRFGH